jgi:hypothetical protein
MTAFASRTDTREHGRLEHEILALAMTRNQTRSVASVCAIAIALCCLGCRTGNPSTGLGLAGALSSLAAVTADWRRQDPDPGFGNALTVLETDQTFADTVEVAREAEVAKRDADPRCVALYAQVALACWPALQATDDGLAAGEIDTAAWEVYHHSVAQFVQQAAVHGQLDPSDRVSLLSPSGESLFIPITHHGFPWAPDDFSELQLVKQSDQVVLERYWDEQGLGVPLVALRRRETSDAFMGQDVPFSATCILRPRPHEQTSPPDGSTDPVAADNAIAAVLEVHDPIRVKQIAYEDRQWHLARDLSAPLALASRDVDRDTLSNFLNPARTDDLGGLRMMEPYQPGKIPIVVVHGLLSDKYTWVDLVNDLRSVENLNDHYQIWAFQYATGQPFIRSAAEMRRDLSEIVRFLDPNGTDAALTQMVLIGHSMGGLVSKLQVSHSESSIWDSVASRRVEEIQASPELRDEIETLFFFEPLPCVKRVIFIGSPHRGSAMAKGVVGRLGSALVMTPNDKESRFKTFVRANPDVFTGDLATRLPSSIDLLRPDNPMLLATYKLRVNADVRLHTIIGTGRDLKDGTPADGVVAVGSARHPGTVSELHIDTTHTQLTSHPETTTEVVRILGEHLNQIDLPGTPVAPSP